MPPSSLNLYWVAATALAVWFLLIHSPPILLDRQILQRPLFLIHIVGAYTVYLACIHNTGRNAFATLASHIVIGKIGMLCGVIGFVGGLVCVITQWHELDKGFSIGITIGGSLQMMLQSKGYQAIQEYRRIKEQQQQQSTDQPWSAEDIAALQHQRNNALRTHICCMVGLFVSACGTPALMRLVDKLGFQSTTALLVGMGAMQAFKLRYQTYLTQHLQPQKSKAV